jgi:hypothetical protein
MNSLVRTHARQNSQTDRLAREWLVGFAELYRVSLADRGPRFVEIWVKGVCDLEPEILDVACQRAVRTYKFFPTPAEIHFLVDKTQEIATAEAAESEWRRVLELRRRFWNPDMRSGFSRGMPKLSDRVQQAANAAGLFRDVESAEALHVWAKKRFIESFTAYGELERDEFLLPAGEIKNILSEVAQKKMLPAASDDWSECRARGEAYRAQLATQGVPDLSPEERLRIADELAATARKLLDRAHEQVMTVPDERREALRYQAKLIKSRYPNEAVTNPALRANLLDPECPPREVDALT